MSAQSIAVWNALPMQPSEESHSILKRTRSDYEQAGDDDDDDVSLVSRSPSPSPADSMDVDNDSLSKYDEFVRGVAREVITIETKIKPTNKGFAMLANMGWKEGQPLGLSGDGRVDPIPFQVKTDSTGLGKLNQDVRMIETTVSQRRGLDSERQHKETEEQRRAREDAVAKRAALDAEISTTLKAFYCSLCDKQFKNVAQYDEHTNSYAHHHKARARDMQANARIIPKEELDKRKEKERKREEKELRKMAAAIGIKMSKPSPAGSLAPVPTTTDPVSSDSSPNTVPEQKHTGFKKSGWATVSTPATQSSTSHSGLTKGGWASVGDSTPATTLASTESPHVQAPSGWMTVSPPTNQPPQQPPHAYNTSHFRTGGWTSLDTTPSNPAPPAQPLVGPPPQLTSSQMQTHSRLPSQPATSASEKKDSLSSWQQFKKSGKGRR